MRRLTRQFARELGVVGLMNVQYAVRDGVVYVLEVNPRASRTVPFVSKATGVSFARLAARIMAGAHRDLDLPEEPPVAGIAVKEAVLPFNKFDVDIILGPEMRSTGEVMGFDESFGMAFAKAEISAGGAAAVTGHGVRHGERPRQGHGHAHRPPLPRPRLPRPRDRKARTATCAPAASRRERCSRSGRAGRTSWT
jgi:hypothetical protein